MSAVASAALSRIGVTRPRWKTLVVEASAQSPVGAIDLWDRWSDIDTWASMTPLLDSADWTEGEPWHVGSQFEQQLQLGFPIGSQTSTEIVGAVDPGRSASWNKDESGIKSDHVWQFDTLDGGGTRVTNVEVFHGLPIGLIKPLVARRWQRLFQQHVDGLVAAAAT